MIYLCSFYVSSPKYLLNTKEENDDFVLKNWVNITLNTVSGLVPVVMRHIHNKDMNISAP